MPGLPPPDRAPIAAIREMLGAFRYLDERLFEWGPKTYEAAPGGWGIERELPPSVREVTHRLYETYYCAPDPGRGAYTPLVDDTLRREFLVTLDDANATPWAWQRGWRFAGYAGQKIVLRATTGALVRVDADEFDGAREDGAPGRLRLRKGSGKVQPPWYHVRGETDHDEGPTVRVYWNLAPAGGVPLVRTLTSSLNAAGLPFHFKIFSDPQRFTRADVAVLYLASGSWSEAAAPIRATYRAVAPWMKAATPLFTRRLARGLAAAEDPPGDSFGLSRSRLVALGLWDAHLAATEAPDAKLAHVRERFAGAGLDLERPWLQPGSRADYALDVEPTPLPLARG